MVSEIGNLDDNHNDNHNGSYYNDDKYMTWIPYIKYQINEKLTSNYHHK